MAILDSHKDGFPSSDSDEDVSVAKQQPKQTAVKQKRSNRISDVEKRSEKPEPTGNSNFDKQKTRKHVVPSPLTSDESATAGERPERKSHTSPDSNDSMEIKNTVELRIRLRCKCDGCISKLRDTVKKFKGAQRVAVKADKDMVKVIGSMEKKELICRLEKKLRKNLASLPIQDYDNVVNDCEEDEAATDCSLGITTTVQPTCQHSRDDNGIMQPVESTLLGVEQKVTSTVVLKIRQYCQGCVEQTRKTIENFQGVESLDMDADEGQVKVTGAMKVEELVSYLQKKLSREVLLVSEKRIENVTKGYKGLLQSGKNIMAASSKGCGEEVKKVAKVDNVTKASKESKTMSKVHVCAKGMHKEDNVSGGRDVKSQKASKKSKVVSRVHPVNLDEQVNVNPDISQNKTQSGINGDATRHLENSMEGKRRNRVTDLMTFGLYCDEGHLEQTRETAMKFAGVELAKIDSSKGLIMVIGAVDQEKLLLYLKEKLKRDVLVVPIQRNDIAGDCNKVSTNICGVNYGHVKGDMDIDSLYLQNYGVDSQSRWMSPPYRYVSPFSDEYCVVSRDEQDIYFWNGY